MKIILVTGGAGFIGSNFIKYFLRRNKNFIIVNLDKLTYSGNLSNLSEIEDSPRHHFVKGDICNQDLVNYIMKRYRPDYVINFAAETDAKRSNEHPLLFTQTNIVGTLTLLESARYTWRKNNSNHNCFIQVSTDEVYGYNGNSTDFFIEESNLCPENTYSATKASAEMLTSSFFKAHNLPAIIIRPCSTYGPFQHKESPIPSYIINSLQDRNILFCEEDNVRREWVNVQDLCISIIRTMFYGKPGEIYNVGTGEQLSNVELAGKILKLMGKPQNYLDSEYHKTEKQRALNSYKTRNNLKWSNKLDLDEGLKETVNWYKSNRDWWDI